MAAQRVHKLELDVHFVALMQQQQWDPFLLINSIGILLGFRTVLSGFDDNMRRRLPWVGLATALKILDHICHTVPPAVLASLVSRNQRVPRIAVYAMVLSTWSAPPGARLDASDVYVPHPWKRVAWDHRRRLYDATASQRARRPQR